MNRQRDPGNAYRFERLTLPIVMKDLYFTENDSGPGDLVPAFDVPTIAGGRFRTSDLTERGPALLIFGSSTCPMTDSAAVGLNELHTRFGRLIRFVMVDVREAHPGRAVPQPHIYEAKMTHARRLRELHGFEFEIAVDDVDGTLHRALSPKPNSAYVLGPDGIILFRAHWANDTRALAAALAAVAGGKVPSPSRSGGLLRPMLRMLPHLAPVLDRAGTGAWADMWRVAAPLAAIAIALKAWGRRASRATPAAADDALSRWLRGDI
jgi:hypothetical protein